MGGIDLDPATTKAVNDRIKAKKFYTKQDNGLLKEWKGRVFLNPPGGRIDSNMCKPVKHGGMSSAKFWWDKLSLAYEDGKVTQAIFIAFSMELLQTSQIGLDRAATEYPICIPRRRIAFDQYVKGKFTATTGPTHANAIIYLGPNKEDFALNFQEFGSIMVPCELI